jgi:xanthine dehydrogenase/oxidase
VTGKNLFDCEVFRTALKILDAELHPDHVLPDASPEYRKGLAAALFYKVTVLLYLALQSYCNSGVII